MQEQDTDFAPDVLYYVLKLGYEENANKHHVMLLITDFVSTQLQLNAFYFTEARAKHDLILELIIVLDDINHLSREVVLDHYYNLTSNDLILTPPGFDDLSVVETIALSCSSTTLTTSLYSSTNYTTSMTTKAQQESMFAYMSFRYKEIYAVFQFLLVFLYLSD